MIPPFAYGGISVPISFFRLTTGPSRWTSDILGFQEELVRGGYDQVALCYRQFIASLIVKPPVLLTHLNVKYPTTIGSAMRPIDLTDPILRQDLVTARYLPFVDYLQLPFEFYLCAVSKESVTDNVTRVLNRVDLMLARYRDSFWLRSILSVGLWPSTRSPIYVEGLRKPALPIYVFPVTYHRVTEQMPDVLRQHYLDNFT